MALWGGGGGGVVGCVCSVGQGDLQTYGILKFIVACSKLDYILLLREGSTSDACFEI
jgi:hypothetical protein